MDDITPQDELAAILYKTLLEKIRDQQEEIEFLEGKNDHMSDAINKAVDRADKYLEELHNAEQEILSLDRKVAELEDKLLLKTEAQGKADYQAYLAKANNERERALERCSPTAECDCHDCQDQDEED